MDWRISELQKRIEELEAEVARQNELIKQQMLKLVELRRKEGKQ